MPPRWTTDNLGIGQPEHASDELLRLLNAISFLTDQVNELQINPENQKQINSRIGNALANSNTLKPVQQRFWEGPLALHVLLNPKHTILRFDIQNYSAWLDNFTTIITFVYKISQISIDKFLAMLNGNNASSMLIVILQTIDNSTKKLLSKQNSTPASLFLTLKLHCYCLSHLHKLGTVRNLIANIKVTQSCSTS
ncbi:hypothetical protein O181_015885 [Austropuccinia psidii MF-1]|uniref:Uncharacterized protein n=1 Tax=Austropuccinia psidii MF-1 TaxID=1389203 RepID=A0A9Q3GRD5_9BASI|nr:hypothetical protein [Austropuccinia psidii MF-1]